jgi:hypothetical protein
MFGKYSFLSMIKEAAKNKDILISHLKGQSVEGFSSNQDKIFGLTLTMFIIMIIITAIVWFTALYLLITRYSKLETWAIIVAVIGY